MGITIQDDLGWEINVNNLLKKIKRSVIIFNNAQVSNFFAQSKILKFEDFVHYRNINLVKNSIENSGPDSFNDFFIQTQEIHHHKTRGALNNLIDIPQSRTSFYGTHSIRSKSAIAWNTMQHEL